MTFPLRFVSMCAAFASLAGYLGTTHHAGAVLARDTGPEPVTVAVAAATRLYPGTVITVRLSETLTSETARRGERWVGTIASPVVVNTHLMVPRGSRVEGQVVTVRRAKNGSPGIVHLAATSVIVDGRETTLEADAGPVIAGTPRAYNLGSGEDGYEEGLDAAASVNDGMRVRGEPVVLRPGTVMGFMVNESVLLR
jgi:hypothetical protein